MKVEYFKPAFVVYAALGIHLVEPFYCTTITVGATHSSLGDFYKAIYLQMGKLVTADFFKLDTPWFDCVSINMFKGVKNSYSSEVVAAITDTASKYMDDCIKLCNFILPELKIILGRQRRDYGICQDFPAQYPVNEQASNINDIPVENNAMERMCGKVDYRLHKLKKLDVVGRSLILQQTEQLRKDRNKSFRTFSEQALQVKELKMSWNKSMKEKFAAGVNEKQALAMIQEGKRLDILHKLKNEGGPFTSAQEVDIFMSSNLKEEIKKKRMKLEIKFARDSSTYLPKNDALFKIQIQLPNKHRRDKHAEEYAIALRAILGKRSDTQSSVTLEHFRNSLDKTLTISLE